MVRRQIAVVVSGFPRRSETFALGELNALAKNGLLAAILPTKAGDGEKPHPAFDSLKKYVTYLPPGTAERQAAFAAEWLRGSDLGGVHGYFAHRPAEVASRLAGKLGVRFGFSVHARDARKIPHTALVGLAKRAAVVEACNPDVKKEFGGDADNISLLPHGVDTNVFRPFGTPTDSRTLIAVGRLVEKKGFNVLIDAVSRLEMPFRLEIIGYGPEKKSLERQVAALNLRERIGFSGGMTHEDLPSKYACARMVVVPSVVDSEGDRDGLPNVVLEAMASGKAVIATDVGAIGEAVVTGKTGILTRPNDPERLAAAIRALMCEEKRADRLGAEARREVKARFDIRHCARRFTRLLEERYV